MLSEKYIDAVDWRAQNIPIECENEVVDAVCKALDACQLYIDCEYNSREHLRLVMVPAVEQAVCTAVMEYDGDLWADWATDGVKIERQPAGMFLGQQQYKVVIVFPWERIARDVVEAVLNLVRKDP